MTFVTVGAYTFRPASIAYVFDGRESMGFVSVVFLGSEAGSPVNFTLTKAEHIERLYQVLNGAN